MLPFTAKSKEAEDVKGRTSLLSSCAGPLKGTLASLSRPQGQASFDADALLRPCAVRRLRGARSQVR